MGIHIFKGPSTALGGEPRGTRPCNATLHDMKSVEPEHVAYSCVLVSPVDVFINSYSHPLLDSPLHFFSQQVVRDRCQLQIY